MLSACPDEALSQVFLPWVDPGFYDLVPQGTCEKLTDWDLTDAVRVQDNETFHVNDEDDRWSLSLPPGSSATSPSLCVGVEHPVFRLFARNRGSATSTLRVEVLYRDATGTSQSAVIAELLAGRVWGPTSQLPVLVNVLALSSSNPAFVNIRFSTTDDDGDWRIDDLYVDPYRKG